MMVLGLAYVRYADVLVGLFDDTPSVLFVGREYLYAVAWSYVALGVGLVLSQAMTGAGATLSSMVLDVLVLLGGIVPAAYVVTEGLGLGRDALWRVIAAGNVLAMVVFVVYYGRRSFLGARV
jgi:Na+-driven multidrug efflux pump